jgi:hypothetical protein
MTLWIALLSPMAQAASLKALDVAALPGDRVELKLAFDEPPPALRATPRITGADRTGSAGCRQSIGEQNP